ncbi:MAG TPA: hypothetical protein VNV42_08375 [Solirubrobacteraceae bacterium]|nr:hypothetical protein [Solirubrobacteraceae bacterium]
MELTASVGRVQSVVLPGGEQTWTVLGADFLPVAPVEEFLEHHRVIGSSPNTVKSYAQGVGLWWRYLAGLGVAWDEPRIATATGFISWLQKGIPSDEVIRLPSAPDVPSRLANGTVGSGLAAVSVFYRYHESATGLVVPGLAANGRSPHRPFMAHLSARRAPRRGLARLRRSARGPWCFPLQHSFGFADGHPW